MKDFKNIFATQLDIQEKPFGKKKTLVNCTSFQIMPAKHCSGHYVTDITLLELKQHQFKIVVNPLMPKSDLIIDFTLS